MKKIRLDLDALSVESFDTSNGTDAKGTVVGHGPPTDAVDCETVDLSCGSGCFACTSPNYCGTLDTDCGTCATYCGTCNTDCGTCDPYCCCSCSCC
jgi:hypothetical protein